MISICIPTYNRAGTLAKAIACARAQTHPDLEIVVVDNHSTDGTEALVREAAGADRRIRLVRHAENLGMARNFSACIAEARGEYVKFLCDDDLLEPECVAKLFRAFSQPGVALSACARRMVADHLRPARVAGTRSTWRSGASSCAPARSPTCRSPCARCGCIPRRRRAATSTRGASSRTSGCSSARCCRGWRGGFRAASAGCG